MRRSTGSWAPAARSWRQAPKEQQRRRRSRMAPRSVPACGAKRTLALTAAEEGFSAVERHPRGRLSPLRLWGSSTGARSGVRWLQGDNGARDRLGSRVSAMCGPPEPPELLLHLEQEPEVRHRHDRCQREALPQKHDAHVAALYEPEHRGHVRAEVRRSDRKGGTASRARSERRPVDRQEPTRLRDGGRGAQARRKRVVPAMWGAQWTRSAEPFTGRRRIVLVACLAGGRAGDRAGAICAVVWGRRHRVACHDQIQPWPETIAKD